MSIELVTFMILLVLNLFTTLSFLRPQQNRNIVVLCFYLYHFIKTLPFKSSPPDSPPFLVPTLSNFQFLALL